jgi:CBS domain-containing protein
MRPCFKTVGEIKITNKLSCEENVPAYTVALELLETNFQGLAVLNRSGRVVGKLTEIDLLNALRSGRDLKTITAGEIMAPIPPVVGPETLIEEAIEIMDLNRLVRLPVIDKGRFIGSVTRHDLLRAWLGMWLDYEKGSHIEVIG